MSAPTDRHQYPQRFQEESLALVNKLIPLTSSGFYLVGKDMQHRDRVFLNVDSAADLEYERTYRDLDPLNPAKFRNSGQRLVTIDSQVDESELLASRYYREFMMPMGHRHVADMFFRYQGDIIAVLTMLRSASLGPYTEGELDLLLSFQPFLEYTLNTVYLPKRYQERSMVRDKYRLTDREVDVAELIVAGMSNKLIAQELGLGLATIKTHIQHIFEKSGVNSRTELLARILADVRE